MGLARSAHQRPLKPVDDDLVNRICHIAVERRRFGYRRIQWMLEREGIRVNHKKVYRIYQENQLSVRKRRRRDKRQVERIPLIVPPGPNHTWSMDFVFDATAMGHVLKCLTVVDDCTKESIDIAVHRRLNGRAVVEVLDRACQFRGYPSVIRTDQGPEFTGKALAGWAHDHGVKLLLIQPGKPTQNAYIESFNGRFRDECLNENWFVSLTHAQAVIAAWRSDYNQRRPHSALSKLTPNEFAAQLRATGQLSPSSADSDTLDSQRATK